MKRWLRRIALFLLAIVALVAIAIALAWWTTNPPDSFAPGPPPQGSVATGSGTISVGAAAVDVTPEPASGLYLGGFGLNRKSTGAHDPIFARAIAIEAGSVRVVFVELDVIGIHHHHAARVRAKVAASAAIVPENVLVLATHDHSAPDTLGLWGKTPLSSGIDPAFLDRALDGAASAATRALASLRPARLTLAVGRAPAKGISKNKRDPDLIDRDVLAIGADGFDGKPIATAVVFACHPEVRMSDNREITADFPGALVRTLEAKRGGTAIFVNGPLGGMVTPDVEQRGWDEVERVGSTVAGVALDALGASGATRVESAKIAWVHRPIIVPVQNRGFIMMRKLGVFDRPFVGAGYIESEVDALRLGPLLLASVPGEALPRVGFEIKTALDAPFRGVIGLGGDELGYLIPEDAFQDPNRYRYEKTVSPGPLATTLIRGTAIQAGAEATDKAR